MAYTLCSDSIVSEKENRSRKLLDREIIPRMMMMMTVVEGKKKANKCY